MNDVVEKVETTKSGVTLTVKLGKPREFPIRYERYTMNFNKETYELLGSPKQGGKMPNIQFDFIDQKEMMKDYLKGQKVVKK